jgi:hypothetical protein
MNSRTTRWLLPILLAAAAAVGFILWKVGGGGARALPDAVLDGLVMDVIERRLVADAQRAVGQQCSEWLEVPLLLRLDVQCETTATGVSMKEVRVLGDEDGGVVEKPLLECVTGALKGLENQTTTVRNPVSDGGVRLPVGRAYQMELVLEARRWVGQGYVP